MTTTVFLVVIAAAFLHALWNALLKSGADKFVGMSAVMLGQAPLAGAGFAYLRPEEA